MKRLSLAIITLLACAGAQAASEEKVTMNLVTSQGVGQAIGTVTIAETAKGLKFTPDLKALPFICTWLPCAYERQLPTRD